MISKNQESVCRTLRRIFACGASLAALSLGVTSAQAQEAAAGTGDDADTTIVVTGSRLITNGMQAPVPVTSVSTEELQNLAPDTLVNGISNLPQFYGNETPNNGNFFNRGGYGTLNLRGLGINRTLTLLNGRRMPSSSSFGGVDINLFPEAMISGVETVTGGASAAYGTDAVAGVVNFKIDTKFTGLDAKAQYGITDRGDGQNYEFSAAWGADIGDRGHIQLSAEKFRQDGIYTYEGRDWYQAWGTINTGTSAAPYYEFYPNTISSNVSFDGIIFAPGKSINGLNFDSNGNYAPYVLGSVSQGAVGAPGSRTSGGSGDDMGAQNPNFISQEDRYSIFAYGDYELGGGLKFYAQFIRGETKVQQYANGGLFNGAPAGLTIYRDNAFLPAALNQVMIDQNIASFNLRRTGSLQDIGNLLINDHTTQNIATAGLTWDISSGGFMDGWHMDANYQYGYSLRDWRQDGVRLDRIFAAVDAVDDGHGNIVCRVSTSAAGAAAFPGCVPLNLFGRGNASAAAIDYVDGYDPGQQITTDLYFAGEGIVPGLTDSYTSISPKNYLTTFKQHQAEISFAGNLMDGWAGPISMAFGGNWRRESVYQIVRDPGNPTNNNDSFFPVLCDDPNLKLRGVPNNPGGCKNTVDVQFSKVSNIRGTSEVKEAFLEALLPLADSSSFTSALSGSVRWADYSGSGTVWAYKTGLEVGFADEVRLRGTYSRDVRAANMAERFNQTGGLSNIVNSKDGNLPQQVIFVSGGNPAVKPEKADTYTLGLVATPSVLPGLSLSIDWYKISLNGAISTVGTQNLVDGCAAGTQQYCDQIDFVSGDSGPIALIRDVYINIAKATVSGVDAEVSYKTSLHLFGGGNESLGMRAFASWLTERSEVDSGGIYIDRAGQTGAQQNNGTYYSFPDFKLTGNLLYRNGGFSSNITARYIGKAIQDVKLTEGVSIADNSVDSVLYVDLRLSYDFDIGGSAIQLFGNVTNLFDKSPPIAPAYSTGATFATQTNSAVYDVMGRRFTVGVKLKM